MKYSLLKTEGCDVTAVAALFADIRSVPGSALRSAFDDRPADIVLLDLTPENLDVAAGLCADTSAAVLVLARGTDRRTLDRCISSGIMLAAPEALPAMIYPLLSMRMRLSRYESANSSLERRLSDAKLINRAKVLLVSRLKMDEPTAHRYIEKTAMDSGQTLRQVAENILRIYEE